jgi:hypothetical protein
MIQRDPPVEGNRDDEQRLTTADLAGTAEDRRGQPGQESQSGERTEPLFPAEDGNELRARWDAIQAGFVDEPRRAVEEADSLVAMAMKRLAETFAQERQNLEAQWDRGDDISTEDLRLALRKYRSFFGRLLSM